MSRRRRDESQSRKPLALWEPPSGAGEPIACLATTFEFDATFFETECLGRFLGMETQPGESDPVGYLIEREEKLRGPQVCVLVDRHKANSKESLRWDVLPVVVPRGIQHAKLSLLVWSNCVRVNIASGNLTEPGYRKNIEVFGSLELLRDEGGPREQVLLAFDFLEAVIERSVGDALREGPKQRAGEILSAVRRRIRDWPAVASGDVRVAAVFCGLGQTVFEQLAELWPSSLRPRRADVISPFFDREPETSGLIPELLTLLSQRGEAEVMFHLAGDRQPDGTIRVQAPQGLMAALPEKWDRGISLVKALQEGETELRPLHAKMLELTADDCVLRMIGSSNFTTAGYGSGNTPGNLEANLVYVVRGDREAENILSRVWPTVEELDLDSESFIWNPMPDETSEELIGTALPIGFREVLFCPAPEPYLLLVLDDRLPEQWSVSIPSGSALLSSTTWRAGQTETVVPWFGPPPFIVCVHWMSASGPQTADWPVNVSDPMQLAPPEELRSLSLAELIQVLSSTRPIHDAVLQVLRKRGKAHATEDDSLNPHQRINTETFLLQRLKRVAVALDGIRERLERPASHASAFSWRLFGPIGPRALHHALTREARSSGEVRFFAAELALALKRVDIDKVAAGGLARTEARKLLKQCLTEITATASGSEVDGPLERYVAAAFEEVMR